jgi:hypothetical protein
MISFLLVAASIVALAWMGVASARDAWRQVARADSTDAESAKTGAEDPAAPGADAVRWTELDDRQLTRLLKEAAS